MPVPQPRFKKEYDKSKPTLSQKLAEGKRLTLEESASLRSLMVELALKKLPRDSEGNAIQVPGPDPLAFDEDPTQFGPEVTPGMIPYREHWGPYREHVFDWLKLIYWESTPGGFPIPQWTFQISAVGTLPTSVVSFAKEGITLYVLSPTYRWVRVGKGDMPLCPAGASILVEYPVHRGAQEKRMRSFTFPMPPNPYWPMHTQLQ